MITFDQSRSWRAAAMRMTQILQTLQLPNERWRKPFFHWLKARPHMQTCGNVFTILGVCTQREKHRLTIHRQRLFAALRMYIPGVRNRQLVHQPDIVNTGPLSFCTPVMIGTDNINQLSTAHLDAWHAKHNEIAAVIASIIRHVGRSDIPYLGDCFGILSEWPRHVIIGDQKHGATPTPRNIGFGYMYHVCADCGQQYHTAYRTMLSAIDGMMSNAGIALNYSGSVLKSLRRCRTSFDSLSGICSTFDNPVGFFLRYTRNTFIECYAQYLTHLAVETANLVPSYLSCYLDDIYRTIFSTFDTIKRTCLPCILIWATAQ